MKVGRVEYGCLHLDIRPCADDMKKPKTEKNKPKLRKAKRRKSTQIN